MNTLNRMMEEGTPEELQSLLEDIVDKNQDFKDELRSWIAAGYPAIQVINTTTFPPPKRTIGLLLLGMSIVLFITYYLLHH